jgi:hypothetical protein
MSETEFNFLLFSGSSRFTAAYKIELLGSELLISSVGEFIICKLINNSVYCNTQ